LSWLLCKNIKWLATKYTYIKKELMWVREQASVCVRKPAAWNLKKHIHYYEKNNINNIVSNKIFIFLCNKLISMCVCVFLCKREIKRKKRILKIIKVRISFYVCFSFHDWEMKKKKAMKQSNDIIRSSSCINNYFAHETQLNYNYN